MDLIQYLAKQGLIKERTASSLEYEVQSSDKKAEYLILEKDLLDEKELFEAKSEMMNVPLKKVYAKEIDEEALEIIPRKTAEQYRLVPIGREEDTLLIGMVHPESKEALNAVKFLSRQKEFSYEVRLITPSDYREVLRRYKGLKKAVSQALEEMKSEEKKEKTAKAGKRKGKEMKAGEWGRLAQRAPISRVVDVILQNALEGDASDVHIEPFGGRLRVRFRRLGKLHSSILLPAEYLPSIVARVKILADLRIDESRIPQDGRFSREIEGRNIDFRVATFPTGTGEKVAIRILDPNKGLKSFHELGLSGRNLEIIEKTVRPTSGMILVSGPTGSGKTTTLYAILRLLNDGEVNIVTLEDPIEYLIDGVNQSQIKPQIGYNFAQGLRFVLRQDPDIVMVGEIRDKESATLAFHAGLTGHLVLSTLHTLDVFSIIPRLARLGVERYLFPVALKAVVAQRLVRELCDNCKKEVEGGEKKRKIIEKELENLPAEEKKKIDLESPLKLWEPVGCRECDGKGYSGRTGVFEVLEIDEALSEVMLGEKLEEERIKKVARKQGMVTMRESAMLKALNGITTLEEALSVGKE